jgi:hypothetical protein
MSKTLVNVFGWVPVVGTSIKVAYVSKRALEIANGTKMDFSDAAEHGAELETQINEFATAAYEEHLKPEVDAFGLPGFVTDKASAKAIGIISSQLKKKYTSKVS